MASSSRVNAPLWKNAGCTAALRSGEVRKRVAVGRIARDLLGAEILVGARAVELAFPLPTPNRGAICGTPLRGSRNR